MPEIGRQTLDYLKMRGDIDLGAYKLKTTNLLLREFDASRLTIRDVNDTAYKGLLLDNLYPTGIIYGSFANFRIITGNAATAFFTLESYTGTAHITNLKLIGGYVEIYQGKLTSDLDINNKSLINVVELASKAGNYSLYISSKRTSANAGNGLFIRTYSSLDANTNRIIITSGVDVADIKIVNAYIDFNDQTLAATAGTLAGYFIIKVGGTQYKVPAYNLS